MASRVNKRSTVYELCKKRIELKNKFQNSQSQPNSDDFELRISAQQNWILPNESSNMLETSHQYIENYKKKMDNFKLEPQSDSMSNKSEFCRENLDNFLEKVPIKDQGIQTNSWLKYQLLKRKIVVCSICYSMFENKTVLIRHVKKFHGKKRGRPAIPVECNVCQMKFACKRDYAMHYRIHSNKTYVCPFCKKMCFFTISHTCKNKKNLKKEPKRNVWDACKEVLTEKPSQQVSSANFESVPKLPITKKVVFFDSPQNKMKSKNLKQSLDKIISKYRPLCKKNKIINHSCQNNISCVQDSVEQLLVKFKNLSDLQSGNPMYFKTEATNSAEIDDPKLFCKICNMSFDAIEKYDTHYLIHSDEEFCQIKEGDEELHVCYVCGGCFTEINAFQAHKHTHVDKEWSDIKS